MKRQHKPAHTEGWRWEVVVILLIDWWWWCVGSVGFMVGYFNGYLFIYFFVSVSRTRRKNTTSHTVLDMGKYKVWLATEIGCWLVIFCFVRRNIFLTGDKMSVSVI